MRDSSVAMTSRAVGLSPRSSVSFHSKPTLPWSQWEVELYAVGFDPAEYPRLLELAQKLHTAGLYVSPADLAALRRNFNVDPIKVTGSVVDFGGKLMVTGPGRDDPCVILNETPGPTSANRHQRRREAKLARAHHSPNKL